MSDEFDVQSAWATLRETARRMGEASDPAIYDALKGRFEALVRELRIRQAEPPPEVLADPLLRTQFVAKSSKTTPGQVEGVEIIDELFGVKITPRAVPVGLPIDSPAVEFSIPSDWTPPTADQLAEIDDLLRRSKVAQMRGDRNTAIELMKQAETIAPYASPVLEAIGDECAASRRFADARTYYDKARQADPANNSAEKKYADAVFRSDAARHVYTGLDDSEVVADPKRAAVLSYLVPGLGQLATGQIAKGVILLLLTYGLGIIAIRLGLVAGLAAIAGARPERPPHSLAYVFGLAALVLYFVNVLDMASRAKTAARRSFDRPAPPENLPYE